VVHLLVSFFFLIVLVSKFLCLNSAYQYSVDRYMYGYQTIFGYENAGTIIGDVEAINISSTMADKGISSSIVEVSSHSS
jgi:hypothetical protein